MSRSAAREAGQLRLPLEPSCGAVQGPSPAPRWAVVECGRASWCATARRSPQAEQNDQAAASARAAHDASRAAGDRAELANALRLLGISALRRGDSARAREHLEQALVLDRELGAPRKIVLDLLALGRAAALDGQRDAARAYYARALAVSEADRDSAGATEARALLDGVDKAATGK